MRPRGILALDCSFTTGWADSRGTEVRSGVISFKAKPALGGLRYAEFYKWLSMVVREGGGLPELMVWEQPHHRGGAATEALCGLTTRVQEIAALHSIPALLVHSGEIKKYATGAGNAKKPQMIESASARWHHYRPENDPGGDEADALWLLAWAAENVSL